MEEEPHLSTTLTPPARLMYVGNAGIRRLAMYGIIHIVQSQPYIHVHVRGEAMCSFIQHHNQQQQS